jgi:hypothetical protein
LAETGRASLPVAFFISGVSILAASSRETRNDCLHLSISRISRSWHVDIRNDIMVLHIRNTVMIMAI